MTVDANCTILTLIKKELDKVSWGINCKSQNKEIIENYLRNNSCDIVGIHYCKDDSVCETRCDIIIKELDVEPSIDENTGDWQILVTLGNSLVSKGSPPYNFIISLESDILEITEQTATTLTIKLKPGAISTGIDSMLVVSVTDRKKCKAKKILPVPDNVDIWYWDNGTQIEFDTEEPIIIF